MIRYWMASIACILMLVEVVQTHEYFREYWNTNFGIALPFEIYNICSDSNVKSPYFYGDLNGVTVIGNNSMARSFEITPTERCKCRDSILYFIGISNYERLCAYYDINRSNVICFNQKNGIFKFDVFLNLLKSITIDFTFQTKNQTLLCELSLIDEENVKCLSLNNILKIESIVSYERSYYLITATDSFAIDLHYYLVSHSQNIASRFIFDLKSEQKLNVIKSGGIYNSINNILYKVEQLEYSYLINFDIYHNITLSKTYMFKSEFDQCQYTGYSEFYSINFYAIFECNDFSLILIQENKNKPVIFKSREKLNIFASIIQDRFIIIMIITGSKDFWYSNASALAINSLEEFEMMDFYPMEQKDMVLTFSYHFTLYPHPFEFEINETLRAIDFQVIESNHTSFDTIFEDDKCKFKGSTYNSNEVRIGNLSCEVSKGNNIKSYKIISFYGENSGSFELDNSAKPSNLVSIPKTIRVDSPQRYTFIVEETYENLKRKRINSIEILQCVDYCLICYNSTLCSKCKYEENKDAYTDKCLGSYLQNVFKINVVFLFIMAIFIILVILKVCPLHVYINACNHYQSIFIILFLSYLKYNSYNVAILAANLVFPYFSFLLIVTLFLLGFDSIIPQNSELLIDFIRLEETNSLVIIFVCLVFICTLVYLYIFMQSITNRTKEAINIELNNKVILHHNFCYFVILPLTMLYICLKVAKGQFFLFNKAYPFICILFIYISLIITIISYYFNIVGLMKAIGVYTREIFNYYFKNEGTLKCYFEGLKNEPDCLLFNILHNIKRFACLPLMDSFIICYTCIDSRSAWSNIIYCFLLLLVFVLETVWIFYLIRVYPYDSLSENRILIVNQVIVIIFCLCGIVTYLDSILNGEINDDLLVIIDYIRAILILPFGYLFFALHFIIIKTCYKKKRGIILPRFWSPNNPNLHFSSEESFTEYMPIDPYKRDLK